MGRAIVGMLSLSLGFGCAQDADSIGAENSGVSGKADDAFDTDDAGGTTFGGVGFIGDGSSTGDFASGLPELPDGGSWRRWCGVYGEFCASLTVPLEHGKPDGRTIDIEIGYTPAGEESRGQIWLHQGGPGGTAEYFDNYAVQLAGALGYDIVVLEHRGVNASTELRCPEQMNGSSEAGSRISAAEVQPCLSAVRQAWGDDGLAAFSTTEAALDLQAAVAALRRPDQPVFLYGVSYGTYWMLRFLQVADIDVDGVILDGVVPPGELFLMERIDKTDRVVERLAQACSADEACFSRLGADPWGASLETLARLDEYGCGDIRREEIADLVTSMIVRRQWGLVMPLMYRLSRCSDDDLAAIEHAYAWAFEPRYSGSSTLVYYNVALPEFWARPGDDAYARQCEGGEFCNPDLFESTEAFVESWPRYDEPLVGTWPSTNVPVLAINGDLDVQTPLEEARLIESAGLETLHFVEVREAGHSMLGTSCLTDLLARFVDDPTKHPGGCPEGHGVPLVATEASTVFGVSDPWDGGPQMLEQAPQPRLVLPEF